MSESTPSTLLPVPAAGTTIALIPGSPEFERTATHMAREFAEATAEIVRLGKALKEQTDRLHAALKCEVSWRSDFDVQFTYAGNRHIRPDDCGDMLAAMKRRAWETLVDHLGIKNVMSVAKRKQFEQQLDKGELPDITEDAITGILLGLAEQAKDFAKEAALEVFGILRPPASNWHGHYKTNDAFRVGRRVILTHQVERWGKGFKVHYNREQELTAIDGIFHLLDGKGVMREHKGPLVKAIETCEGGKGETDYFSFVCCKNHNLHLEFKRLDLVAELNLLATGERVLGDDSE